MPTPLPPTTASNAQGRAAPLARPKAYPWHAATLARSRDHQDGRATRTGAEAEPPVGGSHHLDGWRAKQQEAIRRRASEAAEPSD
eukprot:CAMPEP_0119092056 /NCGR_PEP_ID=MMETSP1178-20130426/158562_1 /TAXON_ID=33656 /ORGANISM="unid sp, Strain CCMP2000" /LENGTH=84 /DNA_ID=CAMNT_0007075607 /DNA_START=25 /DNA_END=277 /DNA_ORIENTATION=-